MSRVHRLARIIDRLMVPAVIGLAIVWAMALSGCSAKREAALADAQTYELAAASEQGDYPASKAFPQIRALAYASAIRLGYAIKGAAEELGIEDPPDGEVITAKTPRETWRDNPKQGEQETATMIDQLIEAARGIDWWGWALIIGGTLIPILKRFAPAWIDRGADAIWSLVASRKGREHDKRMYRVADAGERILRSVRDLPTLRKILSDHVDEEDLDVIEEELARQRREAREAEKRLEDARAKAERKLS